MCFRVGVDEDREMQSFESLGVVSCALHMSTEETVWRPLWVGVGEQGDGDVNCGWWVVFVDACLYAAKPKWVEEHSPGTESVALGWESSSRSRLVRDRYQVSFLQSSCCVVVDTVDALTDSCQVTCCLRNSISIAPTEVPSLQSAGQRLCKMCLIANNTWVTRLKHWKETCDSWSY